MLKVGEKPKCVPYHKIEKEARVKHFSWIPQEAQTTVIYGENMKGEDYEAWFWT
jgi:hypothetical protein